MTGTTLARTSQALDIGHNTAVVAPTEGGWLQPDLSFQPIMVGRSLAPIVPGPVGEWWREVLDPTALPDLPSRARQRLREVTNSGIPIKAIVLFHEIPATTRRSTLSRWTATIDRWVHQEAPALGQRLRTSVVQSAREFGPPAARAAEATAVFAAGATVALLGAAAFAATSSVNVIDPVLCVVLSDGSIWEIDRWND